MRIVKTFGWVLIAVGLMVLGLPLISGFTGFFTAYFSAVPEVEFNLDMQMVIVGAVLMFVGLIMVKPKKKTFLSSFD
jgi:formate hydrogenlyase subunit 3/multisubunit Na+/H+ antiporter MnhD subunit